MLHSTLTAPTISLLALFALPACVLPGADDDTDPTADPATDAETGTMTAPSTGDTVADSSATEPGTSGVDPDTSGSESGDDTTTGDPRATDCSQATLRMGNPYFNGDLGTSEPDGQGVLEDPPLRSRHLAEVDGNLIVETQFELWGVEGDQMRRIAGDEAASDTEYQPSGACADVRFLIAAGIASLPGNRLVVADIRGNGLVEIRDPMGDCTAAPIAGNPDAILDSDILEDAAAIGDIDGPGAEARFYGVSRPTSDGDGNVYVIDAGNAAIKRVADDADRTVTTLSGFGGDDLPLAMTVLGGTLYVTGTNTVDDFIWAVDVDSGEREIVFEGRGLFEEIPANQQASLVAATNDGVDLLVTSNKGYVMRLSTAGEPLGVVAGIGNIVDYPELDLSMPVPTDALPVRSYGVNDGSMIRMGSDLLLANSAGGAGYHVWSIACE